jgi:imidazolonepropionase-like amidohydrolase
MLAWGNYEAFYTHGEEFGAPPHVMKKLTGVRRQAINALKVAHDNNVNVGFGTDLLGKLMQFQSTEFSIRKQVETPFQTLHSATYKNAQLLNMEGKLGVLQAGAFADILAVKSNPLEDIEVMADPANNLNLIIKDGSTCLNKLTKD